MFARSLTLLTVFSLFLAFSPGPALAQDADTCFNTADRVTNGEQVEENDKRAAHEACQRALAQTSSVVQKYQLQEADFDIMGTRPKN
jgi:hypothetical protein